MIAGVAKGYNLTPDYVLYKMSYANVIMYSAVLPSYDDEKESKEDEEVINADDPKNRDKVRQILFG
ncbi:MAG: hypothetical protein AAGU19_08100 [Prolixibacteraceae bacterium]